MKLTLRVLAVALGVLQAYWGRHAMTSDGIAYLDIADAFIRHDWAVAIDALWSPLYPLLLSLAVILFKPSPYSEFALVHVVNLVIYRFSIVSASANTSSHQGHAGGFRETHGRYPGTRLVHAGLFSLHLFLIVYDQHVRRGAGRVSRCPGVFEFRIASAGSGFSVEASNVCMARD